MNNVFTYVWILTDSVREPSKRRKVYVAILDDRVIYDRICIIRLLLHYTVVVVVLVVVVYRLWEARDDQVRFWTVKSGAGRMWAVQQGRKE